VAERGRIFEAVAKRAVDANMRDQKQTRARERGQGAEKSRERKNQRQRESVDEIVDRGAHARPGEIGKHRQVRGQEQQRESKQGKAIVDVERERNGERGETLN